MVRGESKKSVQKNPGPQKKFKLMNLSVKLPKKLPPAAVGWPFGTPRGSGDPRSDVNFQIL